MRKSASHRELRKKIVLIGETGTLSSAADIVKEGIGWVSYMTWSNEFCLSENTVP